jgi:hypothetical protein
MMLTTPLAPARATAQAQTSEGSVRLSPAMTTVDVRDGPFTVYVVLEDLQHFGSIGYDDDRDTEPDRQIPSVGLAAFEFTIEYDAAVVEAGRVTRGPQVGQTGRSFQCLGPAREPGRLTYGCLSSGQEPPGAQGTMTLAEVEFVPVAPGLSPLALSAGLAGPLGDDAPVSVSGGAARVTGAAIATPTRRPVSTRAPARTATRTAAQPDPQTATPLPPAAATATAERNDATGTPAETAGPETGTPGAPTAAATDNGNGPSGTREPGGQNPPGGGTTDDEGSGIGGAALWSMIGLGSLIAMAALTLMTVMWRRRDRGIV